MPHTTHPRRHTRRGIALASITPALALALVSASTLPHADTAVRSASELLAAHRLITSAAEPALDVSEESLEDFTPHQVATHEAFPIPGDPITGSFPAAPGDTEHVTIYLDFDGEHVTDTLWNQQYGVETLSFAPASAADPNISASANAFRSEVWAAVAEDFAPFAVNVTTTRPDPADLVKSSPTDRRFGVHLVITDSYDDLLPGITAGGLAYENSAGTTFRSPALVFATGLGGGDPANVSSAHTADATSHEAGHTLGLQHDGYDDLEYFYPHLGFWGPIMGASYSTPLAQWSAGEYFAASNTQDDLAVMSDPAAEEQLLLDIRDPAGQSYWGDLCPAGPVSYGEPVFAAHPDLGCASPQEPLTQIWDFSGRLTARPDAMVPGSDRQSTPLMLSEQPSSKFSVIRSASDVHRYSVDTTGGLLSIDIDVVELHPNFNAQLTLIDAAGSIVAASSPEVTALPDSAASADLTISGLGAEFTVPVASGTYTVEVRGAGQGDPFAWMGSDGPVGGFTSYGSTGNYRLTGSVIPNTPTPPAPAPAPAPPTPEPAPAPPTGSPTHTPAGTGGTGGTTPSALPATGAPALPGTALGVICLAAGSALLLRGVALLRGR